MRLRLRIERNELPAVSVLWAIGDTELKQTVAQFVERVNERIPLEGESWGLEDYAVSVGGYEALHYNEVGTCFQNEDEVLIKPLQLVDSRARTMTGRNQITSDGRHLLDGVPFGKPLLKRPRRPDVHIPPRKRQRMEELEGAENDDGGQNALVRFEELDDEDDEDDADFEMEAEGGEEEEESAEEEEDEIQNQSPRAKRSTKRVAFADAQMKLPNGTTSTEDVQEDSSSEESSDSSDENDSSDSSSDSSDSDSDDYSDSSSDESDDEQEVWNGIASSDPTSPAKPRSKANEHSISAQHALTNGAANGTSKVSAFREGEDKTKIRNARRREQRQLKHLKENGMLSARATLGDMRKLLEEKGLSRGVALKEVVRMAASEPPIAAQRQRLLNDIASGGVDVNNKAQASEEEPDEPPDEEPIVAGKSSRQVLESSGHVQSRDSPSDVSRANAEGEGKADLPPNDDDWDELSTTEPALSQSRKRLNVASMNRMVFGSLGVRAPKTQADKDALQKKLLARSQRAPPAKKPEAPTQTVEEDEEPDSWQDKIEISAVECCDEGVTLSAPPFPFKQRWDPQYQLTNNRTQRRKKRKTNGAASGVYVETYDKYDLENGDALDYDDPVDDDEYWEDGALLDDDSQESVDDGFPKLPTDMSTLANLVEADAMKGDYVVYQELSCTAKTNWEPKVITRTARLDGREDGGWKVTFAGRDLQPKEYDEDGNRIYQKFEMEGASDDEGDEESPILEWATLLEPKLLQRTNE